MDHYILILIFVEKVKIKAQDFYMQTCQQKYLVPFLLVNSFVFILTLDGFCQVLRCHCVHMEQFNAV